MNYPLTFSWKREWFPVLLLIASVILGFYFYQNFPEQVVTHWDFHGQPDGYSGKFWGAFMFPAVLAGIYAVFLGIPLLDPKKDRYQEFEKTYAIFKNSILFVLFIIFLAAGAYNLGFNIRINLAVPLAVGFLFIVMGNYMGKVKSNWFVGIRTPWTLSNEEVWNKTHRFGAKLMMLFGLILIISPFLSQNLGIALFAAGIAAVVFGSTVYSYLLYRKIKK